MIVTSAAIVIAALSYLSLKRTWLRVQPVTSVTRMREMAGLTVAMIMLVSEHRFILQDPWFNLPLFLWMPVSYGILLYRTNGRPIGATSTGNRHPVM
jgi:hypothetical protein